MALNVGELYATITINDRAVAPGLRHAEQAMRTTGQHIASDADQAGTRAGQNLADGVGDGLNDLRRDAQRAGQRAGDALGDGLTDGAGEGGEQAAGRMEQGLGKLKLAAAGIGAAAGAFLIDSFTQAMDQQKATAKLGAQLGATPAMAKMYGQAAGQLYTGAVVDSFDDGLEAIRSAVGDGLVPPGATLKQLTQIGTGVSDLANTFNVEFKDVSSAAGVLLKTGLAKNATEAFDLIAKGMTGLGTSGEDLLETVNEYGVQWKDSGLSASTALGLVRQGIQGGWKDTDKIIDAMKELKIRGTEGSTAVQQAFQKLGLNAKSVGDDLAAGGKRGEKAMGTVLDKLRELGPNTQEAKQIVSTLFGGPGEDLGSALFKLNVDKASKSMDGAAGSAGKFGDALRDNATAKVEQFKRKLQQGVVDFLGIQVLPALTKVGDYLGDRFSKVWDEAGKGADGLPDRVLNFIQILGPKIISKLGELLPLAIEGLTGLGQKIADYVTANPGTVLKVAAIVGAFALVLMNLPELLIGTLAVTAGLIIGGLIGQLLTKLNENLPKWWASFTGWVAAKAGEAASLFNAVGVAIGVWFSGLWSKYVAGPTSRAWSSFINYVAGIPDRAVSAISGLGSKVSSVASAAWQAFSKTAAVKITSFIGWVRGIPGRVIGAIGAVRNLLYSKGRDIVLGLWNGIVGMGSWLRSKLIGWAKAIIPGPVAKALGIGSPSKVMAKQVGHWIPAGIAKGAEDNAGVIEDTMAGLVDVPTPSASMAMHAAAADAYYGGGGSTGRGSSGVKTVQLTGGDAFGDLVISKIREKVNISGGNVQFVLGRTSSTRGRIG
ncbi:phage tail tape measure protein [Streptomyces sp. NPDC050788]|uniref:phage tail tape measure protein n=1 Tax=Streptomyces sp. NPDC050788 TaxID=3155041 RepID=UPI00341CDB6B